MFAVIVHVVSASKFDVFVLSTLVCHVCVNHRCAPPPSAAICAPYRGLCVVTLQCDEMLTVRMTLMQLTVANVLYGRDCCHVAAILFNHYYPSLHACPSTLPSAGSRIGV